MKLSETVKSISAVQGLIGALPGLVAIIWGLSIPPERELLFRSFAIAVMFVVTVLLLTHKREIGSLDIKTKIKSTVFAIVLSGISLILYLSAYEFVVISDTITTESNAGRKTVAIELYLPLIPTGKLAMLIDEVGRHNLISDESIIEANIQRFRSENYMRYLLNDCVFISLYLLVITPLNVLLTSAAILLTENDVRN